MANARANCSNFPHGRMENSKHIKTRFNMLRKLAGTRRYDPLTVLEDVYSELSEQHEFTFRFSAGTGRYIFGFAWLEKVKFNCQRLSCKSEIADVHEIKFCAVQLFNEELNVVFKDEGMTTGVRNALHKAYPDAENWLEFNSLRRHLIRLKDVECPVCGFVPRLIE